MRLRFTAAKSQLVKFSSLIIYTVLFSHASCNQKGFLSEHEKNTLFAAPSNAEIDIIIQTWAQRDLKTTDYTLVQEHQLLDGNYRLKLVSYKVGGIKEYGALLIPKTDQRVPVRMLLGGFGLGITANSVNVVLDKTTATSAFILAIPALRGQSLEITLNGSKFTSPLSEGSQCDAFDGATDDAIAFLNVIQQTEEKADVNRTSMRGGSRGGTVALLAGIRDKRVKKVVGVVSPTNFVELTAQNENDPTYQCQFLSDFRSGQFTLAQARTKLIASSPLYFAQHLPQTQLHMGTNDKIVPISQANELEKKITQLGKTSAFQLYTYDKTHTDIATNNTEMSTRIEQFLSQL
ncbi:alpha/beta hydrolase family protein [Runella limosa]|uniref:alpha/beta hydrolase family protein n=1 Tax=Runella limosa TaxID=370978 RepID=UPI0004904885|nr:prolyl oligopeptidase family serine peptidase [Runella limosa]